MNCPICKAEIPLNPRYPRAVCWACARKARSADGRPLHFFNVSFSGGIAGRYADTGEDYPGQECFIEGVPCWADEAHMGGIVIQVLER